MRSSWLDDERVEEKRRSPHKQKESKKYDERKYYLKREREKKKRRMEDQDFFRKDQPLEFLPLHRMLEEEPVVQILQQEALR